MSSAVNAAEDAIKALRQFAAYTDVNHAAKIELRAAGISESRIESLYPFDLSDHIEAIAEMLAPYKGFQEIGFALPEGNDPSLYFAALPTMQQRFARTLMAAVPVRETLRNHVALWTSHTRVSDDADVLALKWLSMLAFFHACSKIEAQLVNSDSLIVKYLLSNQRVSANLIRYMDTIK